MKRTLDKTSRKLQEIRRKADVFRAETAKARLAGEGDKVAFGQAQIALCAKEMKKVLKDSKKQFWER